MPAPEPVHGQMARIRHRGGPLFAGVPPVFEGVRYHSLAVAQPLPRCLRPLAFAEDGVVMALAHRRRPIWGVQFHPESVGTAHGERLLGNFVALAAQRSRPRRRSRGAAAAQPVQRGADGRRPAADGFRVLERVVGPVPDPARAFAALFGKDPYAFWLDGQGPGAGETVIGTASGAGGEALTYNAGAGVVRVADPLGWRRDMPLRLAFRGTPRPPRRTPGGGRRRRIPGGYVGCLGYELKADLGSPGRHRARTPDACLMFATLAIVIDPAGGGARAIRVAPPQTSDAEAEAELEAIAVAVAALGDRPELDPPAPPAGQPRFGLSPGDYAAAVESAQRALHAGESYEVCLTDTASVEGTGEDPLAIYLRQRRSSPAPYGAFMRMGEVALLSSSPERFLAIGVDGEVESKPIKGTRPRGATAAEDRRLRSDLAASAKDRAENMMVVDLVRNDLGRVCEIGSVTVPSLMAVESYRYVHQLVSTVRGRLRPDRDALDCVAACFPAGSMTGAPKSRTMEIIDSLEPGPRGLYSGAHGYFGLRGDADLGVVIRSIVVAGTTATVGGGGAVTVLSDPKAEHAEMLLKVEALLELLASPSASPTRVGVR